MCEKGNVLICNINSSLGFKYCSTKMHRSFCRPILNIALHFLSLDLAHVADIVLLHTIRIHCLTVSSGEEGGWGLLTPPLSTACWLTVHAIMIGTQFEI